MKRVYGLMLLSVVLIAVLVVGCGKQEPEPGVLQDIKDEGVIVVGTSADYAPFEFVDEQGNYTGFDIELMKEIANRLGVEVEFKDMDFGLLIGALKQGKIDAVIACMTATPERDEDVDFTDPYLISNDAFLVKDGSGIEFSKPEDAASYLIGVQTGTIQETWVNEELLEKGLIDESKIFTYPRADQALLDLKNGKIDILIVDAGVAKQFAADSSVKIVLEVSLTGENPAIAIPEGAADLQAELNKIIAGLQEEGFIDQLEQEFMGNQEE